MIRIVGVDPGYRNLALATLDIDVKTKKLVAVQCKHVDVGSCADQTDIIYKVWHCVHAKEFFKNAQYVEIENQVMGRKNSTPSNVGLSWLIASHAYTQNPFTVVNFSDSKDKFKTFGVPVPFKRGTPKHTRHLFIKNSSIQLAVRLLKQYGVEPSTVFQNGEKSTWEHIADALGLAFTRALLAGLLLVPPPP